MSAVPAVSVEGLTRAYGERVALRELSLEVGPREVFGVLGPNGGGKTTLFRILSTLLAPSRGRARIAGHDVVAEPDCVRRRIGVVFQAPSLVPWLTAYENVALGVERVFPHGAPAERRDTVEYYLGRVGLGDAMHKRAAELSNGMQQRVGIARAFALAPKLLLLDEPFGMLDSLTRWELQEVLMEVWTRSRVTAVMVTHDVDEAILLADRVVMMTNGPRAKVGRILDVPLPRPRTRRMLLAHPQYYALRESLMTFLEECDRSH